MCSIFLNSLVTIRFFCETKTTSVPLSYRFSSVTFSCRCNSILISNLKKLCPFRIHPPLHFLCGGSQLHPSSIFYFATSFIAFLHRLEYHLFYYSSSPCVSDLRICGFYLGLPRGPSSHRRPYLHARANFFLSASAKRVEMFCFRMFGRFISRSRSVSTIEFTVRRNSVWVGMNSLQVGWNLCEFSLVFFLYLSLLLSLIIINHWFIIVFCEQCRKTTFQIIGPSSRIALRDSKNVGVFNCL